MVDRLSKECPEELAHKLEYLLSYRETNAAEIWGAVREWTVETDADGTQLSEHQPVSRTTRAKKSADASKFIREFLKDGMSIEVIVRDDEIVIKPLQEEPQGFDAVEWK